MIIIADENIEQEIIAFLRAQKLNVYSVLESDPGINDNQVIELAKSKGGVLITQDKDFGSLVFAHKIGDLRIILLRFSALDLSAILEPLYRAIIDVRAINFPVFITLTPNKVRVRKI